MEKANYWMNPVIKIIYAIVGLSVGVLAWAYALQDRRIEKTENKLDAYIEWNSEHMVRKDYLDARFAALEQGQREQTEQMSDLRKEILRDRRR